MNWSITKRQSRRDSGVLRLLSSDAFAWSRSGRQRTIFRSLGFDFFLRIQAASLPQAWQPFQGQFRAVIDSDLGSIPNSLDEVTLGVQAVICW